MPRGGRLGHEDLVERERGHLRLVVADARAEDRGVALLQRHAEPLPPPPQESRMHPRFAERIPFAISLSEDLRPPLCSLDEEGPHAALRLEDRGDKPAFGGFHVAPRKSPLPQLFVLALSHDDALLHGVRVGSASLH